MSEWCAYEYVRVRGLVCDGFPTVISLQFYVSELTTSMMSSSNSAEGKCSPAIPSVLPCQSNVRPPTNLLSGPVSSRTRSLAAVEGSSNEHQVSTSGQDPVLACLDSVEALKQQVLDRGLVWTEGQCPVCLRVGFKGVRGVRMHLSKSGCGKAVKSPAVDGISVPEQSISSGSMVVPKPVVQCSSVERNVPCDDSPSDDSPLNFRRVTAVVDEAACLQKVEERLKVR